MPPDAVESPTKNGPTRKFAFKPKRFMNDANEVLNIYISPGHNFFGHHGKAPSENSMLAQEAIQCLAGQGIRGDRFCNYKEDYKGQITFFADEVFQSLRKQLEITDKPDSVFRRNVVTRGVDLNALIGREFEMQGVRFFGIEECKPCYWMDRAFGPGAEEAMKGRGGLRAKVLRDGLLRVGPASLAIMETSAFVEPVPVQ